MTEQQALAFYAGSSIYSYPENGIFNTPKAFDRRGIPLAAAALSER